MSVLTQRSVAAFTDLPASRSANCFWIPLRRIAHFATAKKSVNNHHSTTSQNSMGFINRVSLNLLDCGAEQLSHMRGQLI